MENAMNNQEEVYIANSRQSIDRLIKKKDYQTAFVAFILVLERLSDGKQKNEFIDYYSKNMKRLGIYS
jgi:hypothetical protein